MQRRHVRVAADHARYFGGLQHFTGALYQLLAALILFLHGLHKSIEILHTHIERRKRARDTGGNDLSAYRGTKLIHPIVAQSTRRTHLFINEGTCHCVLYKDYGGATLVQLVTVRTLAQLVDEGFSVLYSLRLVLFCY